MHDPQLQRQFLEQYGTYVRDVLIPTKQEVKLLFKRLREPGYWSKYTAKARLPAPSPIQRAFARLKRPESVVDKISRKPSDFPGGLTEDSYRAMTDTLGVRVVVYFMSNLPLVDKELRSLESLEISDSLLPVAYLRQDIVAKLGLSHLERRDKDSGYASIHYVARLRESSVPAAHRPWFEIQVRTLAEDLWGEIEHILGYKPNKRTSFSVKRQFQILSSSLVSIDEHFNLLYEELTRFQDEVTYRNIDPLNAENLPPVLSECGIGCAQGEIDGLLRLLFSRGIERVGDLQNVAVPRRIDLIRNIYRNEVGRPPVNYEVVATLANMKGAVTPAEEGDLIRAQIAFLDAWGDLTGK